MVHYVTIADVVVKQVHQAAIVTVHGFKGCSGVGPGGVVIHFGVTSVVLQVGYREQAKAEDEPAWKKQFAEKNEAIVIKKISQPHHIDDNGQI